MGKEKETTNKEEKIETASYIGVKLHRSVLAEIRHSSGNWSEL